MLDRQQLSTASLDPVHITKLSQGRIRSHGCDCRGNVIVVPTDSPNQVIIGCVDGDTLTFRETAVIELGVEPRCAVFNDDGSEFLVLSTNGLHWHPI